jgi:hypothetical protein
MEDPFRAWWQESYGLPPGPHAVMTHVAWGEHLLATRPKPPSLKEQALEALKRQSTRSVPSFVATQDCDTIRRALEQLDD